MRQNKFEYSICVIAIVAIFPFVINSLYINPAIDDFLYAYRFFNVSLWNTIKDVYLHWSGRYFATFISIINPLLYSNFALSKIYSILVILLVITSIFYFVKTFSNQKLTSIQICGLTAIILIPFVSYMPDIYAFFYWFSGYITYTIATANALFLISIIYKQIQNNQNFIRTLLFVIFHSLIIAGSNEFTIIQIHGLFIITFLCVKKVRTNTHFFLFYGVFTFFTLIFLIAPGNFVRADICNISVSIQKAIYISLFYTKEFLLRFSGMFLSVGFVYLTIFAPRLHNPKPLISTHPIILAILFIGILFVLQFFSIFTTYTALLYRTENSTVLFALLGWVYILQRIYSEWSIQTKISKLLHHSNSKLISLVVFIAPLMLPTSSITVSYKDLLSGDSNAYNNTRKIQHTILTNAQGSSSIEIPAFNSYPETLLPKRHENQETITKLIFDFGAHKYYTIDTIIIRNDTIRKHPYIHTKLWNYEQY